MMKALRIGLAAIFLTALWSCSGTKPVTVTKTETVNPPDEWMTCPTVEPETIKTNGDLIDYALRLEAALSICRIQMDAIREWTQEPEG